MQSNHQKSEELAERLRKVDSCGISATRKGNHPIFWKEASGALVTDLDDNVFIDCTSGFGVLGVGYSHPAVIGAVTHQLTRLTHTMGGINPHEAYYDALDCIRRVAGRHEDTQVILGLSGSEAVEAALKLACAYTGKPGIIAFYGAYHGQSLGALSVTSHNCFRNPFTPIIAHNVTFAPYPNPYRAKHPDTLTEDTIAFLDEIVSGGRSGGMPIGAVIIEPMQNPSGYIVPPKGFLKKLRAFCDHYDLLLIADEVFTGFGRCGKWLAQDREQTVADITCAGKVMGGGFPVSACIAPQHIMSSLDHELTVGLHGGTFDGNPVACAAVAATIRLLERENLIERSEELGETMRASLRSTLSELPCVGDIRGLGSATVVEFVKDKQSKEPDSAAAQLFQSYLSDRGINTLLTALPFGNAVAFCLPFVLSQQQLDHILKRCGSYPEYRERVPNASV